jgi:hypothetical protein
MMRGWDGLDRKIYFDAKLLKKKTYYIVYSPANGQSR